MYKISQITQIKIRINIVAQEFLKTTCQLWQIQSLKSRIDFKLLLVKNGFLQMDDIKKLFVAPIIAALRELKLHDGQRGAGASSTRL